MSAAADSCQIGKLVGGGVLDARERLVDLEGLSDVLCALRPELIVFETAHTADIEVSAAADSRETGLRRRTRRR